MVSMGMRALVLVPVVASQYSRGYLPRAAGQLPRALPAKQRDYTASSPDSIDWVESGATTAIKDQGMCGSCWAFSVVETVESAVFVSSGSLPSLSTQQVTSCNHDGVNRGCGGGRTEVAFEYAQSVGLEADMDYPEESRCTGKTGKCHVDTEKVVAKVTNFTYAVPPCNTTAADCDQQDEAGLAAALAAHGPISVCVNARMKSWDYYTGGVLRGACSRTMEAQNHCVQLVGYDKTDVVPYWKVRNSWGSAWGEGGFIRLEMGKNLCGVANDAIFATAKLVAPAPKPAPAPPCPTTPTTTTRPMPSDFEELPMHRCAGNIINSTFMKFSNCAWWCAGDPNCACFDYPSSCVRTTKQSSCSLYDTSDVRVPTTGNFTAFPRQGIFSEEFV